MAGTNTRPIYAESTETLEALQRIASAPEAKGSESYGAIRTLYFEEGERVEALPQQRVFRALQIRTAELRDAWEAFYQPYNGGEVRSRRNFKIRFLYGYLKRCEADCLDAYEEARLACGDA